MFPVFLGTPSSAPQPIREALGHVLYCSFLFIRSIRGLTDIPKDKREDILHDLADALHNVPHVMEHYHEKHGSEYLLELFFRPFDRKWKDQPGVLRLESIYTTALKELEARELDPNS